MEWFDKNSAAIIAASAALAASVLAGAFAILGAWVNNIFSNQRNEQQHKYDLAKGNKRLYLDKGEELHSLLTKWGNTAYANFVVDSSFIAGKLSKKQHLEVLNDKFDPEIYNRIHTLIEIYFGEISEDFLKARRVALDAIDIIQKFESGNLNSSDAFELYQNCTNNFHPLLTISQKKLQGIMLKQL
ncbi:hypothetical protein [Pantoea ananatis]|uniref:hypothetical protein n=1 Tax=Pantoea ananas TaxID=553 RepID=UPI00301ABCD6